MTIEELQGLAASVFDRALSELRDTGSINMMFYLVLRSGGLEIIAAMPDVTNDEGAKQALAAKIRARIATGEIEAVVMASDVFFASNMTPEADKVRRSFGMNIEQAHAAGLCEKREAIMVRLESPIYWLHMQQEYTRHGTRINTESAPIRTDALGAGQNMHGRFSGFWPAPEARA